MRARVRSGVTVFPFPTAPSSAASGVRDREQPTAPPSARRLDECQVSGPLTAKPDETRASEAKRLARVAVASSFRGELSRSVGLDRYTGRRGRAHSGQAPVGLNDGRRSTRVAHAPAAYSLSTSTRSPRAETVRRPRTRGRAAPPRAQIATVSVGQQTIGYPTRFFARRQDTASQERSQRSRRRQIPSSRPPSRQLERARRGRFLCAPRRRRLRNFDSRESGRELLAICWRSVIRILLSTARRGSSRGPSSGAGTDASALWGGSGFLLLSRKTRQRRVRGLIACARSPTPGAANATSYRPTNAELAPPSSGDLRISRRAPASIGKA